MDTTPEIVMLRGYGWWYHEAGQNMAGIGFGDGFIKQLVIL